MAAPLRDRLGPGVLGRLANAIGELQVVDEAMAAQPRAEGLQQHPGGLFRRQGHPFIIHQRQAVAVAVEGHAQVGPLPVDRLAKLVDPLGTRAIGAGAVKLLVAAIVNRRQQALGKDGVEVAPRAGRPAAVHGVQHDVAVGPQRIDPHLLQPGDVVEGDVQRPRLVRVRPLDSAGRWPGGEAVEPRRGRAGRRRAATSAR